MKYVFIVNPLAGNGQGLKISENIAKICEEENLDHIIHHTSAPKEATEIAKKYQHEENIIYSIGGDGTLSEVVNGIIGSKNKLGVIPAGSGNDFYKTIKDFDDGELTIDIGKVNDFYFLNILSFGIDAEIGRNAGLFKNKKLIPKSQIYNMSILHTLLKFKSKKMQFTLDGESSNGEYTIVTVCNGRFYGNGYNVAPQAKLDDNLFDIYFVNKLSKFSIVKLVPKLKKGTHETSKHVNKKMGTKIQVKTDTDIVCNIDGETFLGNSFDIELISHAITLSINNSLVEKFLRK